MTTRDTRKAFLKLLDDTWPGVTGADAVTNIISLTQAEYDGITPNSSTLYAITDA